MKRGVLLAGGALGVLALTGAAGCSAGPAGSVGGGPGSTATPTVAAPTPAAATSPPTPAPSPTAVTNLIVSNQVRSELTATFVTYKHLSATDVAGTRPGSVYYAYNPATDTYWALASFDPGKTASLNVQVGFQDGGGIGLFSKVGTGPWHMRIGGIPPICAEVRFFPAAVMHTWALPTDTSTVGGC